MASNRPIMFIPSNFTVDPNAEITFTDCRFYNKDMFLWLTANCFKDHFGLQEDITGWDIVTEDALPVFKDKLDTYTGKQEELLV